MKVDAARRRGGVHIVWLSWFTDSIALWRRQDETPYFLDDPPAPNTSSSAHQISSDPEPDSDDWDDTDDVDDADEGAAKGTGMDLELGTIDWNDINDEVDAAMNESDDDEDEEDETRSEKSTRSEDGSETNSNARFVFMKLPILGLGIYERTANSQKMNRSRYFFLSITAQRQAHGISVNGGASRRPIRQILQRKGCGPR